MLTQLGKEKLDAVIAETCEAQFKLEFTPSTTAELASSLIFLDEIQERVRCSFHIKNMIYYYYFLSCFSLLVFGSVTLTFFFSVFPDYSVRERARHCVSDVQSCQHVLNSHTT